MAGVAAGRSRAPGRIFKLREKLELARALTSHRNPSGDLAVIVERAVEVLIEKLSKEKLGTTSRARRSESLAKHGHVTRQARRETFERDGLRCSFIGENGERCLERSFLEIDHVTARARGGGGQADNCSVARTSKREFGAPESVLREGWGATSRLTSRATFPNASLPGQEAQEPPSRQEQASLRPRPRPSATMLLRRAKCLPRQKTAMLANTFVQRYSRWAGHRLSSRRVFARVRA